MQISHFSTFSPTISGYRIEKTRDIVPLTEYDYLMNCACNPGGDTGINSDCSYNNERSLSVTISGSVSAGLKDVIEASVGTSIGKSVTVTWHHGLRSDNCHDNELYGRWKGNRYHVSIWRNFWPFGEMYLGSFTVDEPTGPEFDTRMKKEFKKNCDKCCRECAPKEISRSNSELVPPKEPCTPSTSGDNCYISGGSITENLNDVPGEQEKKWLDACKEEVKIKHNVDGTISSNGDEYCRCDENSAYEYAGPVSCDKTYHGSYTETVIFDYLAGTCPS
jgi:hypothetical protein